MTISCFRTFKSSVNPTSSIFAFILNAFFLYLFLSFVCVLFTIPVIVVVVVVVMFLPTFFFYRCIQIKLFLHPFAMI